MDKALDEIISDRPQQQNRTGRNRRRNPRGGVRKPSDRQEYSESRAWVHDKFEGDSSSEPFRRTSRQDRDSVLDRLPPGAGRIKVDNLHYDLGQDDLLGLFERQGPVIKLELKYDRAGRSEGVAFVTYELEEDAKRAIAEFDGANANGQPIRLSLVSRSRGNEGRSLFERIKDTASPDIERNTRRRASSEDSRDPRRDPTRKPTPPNIDRYVPSDRRREVSRRSEDGDSRNDRRRGGRDGSRRDNGRREGGGGGGSGSGGGASGGRRAGGRTGTGGNVRPKKTVEELDEEMSNYFMAASGDAPAAAPEPAPVSAPAIVDEDEDMIL